MLIEPHNTYSNRYLVKVSTNGERGKLSKTLVHVVCKRSQILFCFINYPLPKFWYIPQFENKCIRIKVPFLKVGGSTPQGSFTPILHAYYILAMFKFICLNVNVCFRSYSNKINKCWPDWWHNGSDLSGVSFGCCWAKTRSQV